MDHHLSVVVQVDLEDRCVHLVVTGRLTERNHRGLAPLVRRARTVLPGAAVVIDLAGAQHVEQAGLDLLRWSIDHDGDLAGPAPVQVLTRPVPFAVADPLPAPASWNGVAA
jgi:ABC-type transporter Mla MlaB component